MGSNYIDIQDPNLRLSASARRRWKRDRITFANQVLSELQEGRLARQLAGEVRNVILALDDDEQLSRYQATLLGLLKKVRNGETETMSNSARHGVTTVTHSHSHAAHGHPSDDLGEHTHTHTHTGDANHDHSHNDRTGVEEYYSPPGPGVATGHATDGIYSQAMNASMPAAKMRARQAMQAEHEAGR